MTQNTPTTILEHLTRLSSKPGVQSTLVLSRSDGSIIHKSGLLAESSTPISDPSPIKNNPDTNGIPVQDDTANANDKGNDKSAESIAQKVFTFIAQAQRFTEGIDAGDEVRLLRLRTRRNELVIVPGSRDP